MFKNKGIKILKSDIFNHIGMYDVIMLHHSFEHMDSPYLVFKELYKILNSKGYLVAPY